MRMLTAKIQLSDTTTISAWCAPGSRTVMDTYRADYGNGEVWQEGVEISRFQYPVTTTRELVEHLQSLYFTDNGRVVENF